MGPLSGPLSGHLRGQLALIGRSKQKDACGLLYRGMSSFCGDSASEDELVERCNGDQRQTTAELSTVNLPDGKSVQQKHSLLSKLASDSSFVGASLAGRRQQVRRNSTASTAAAPQSTPTVPPGLTTVAPTGSTPVKLHSIIPDDLKKDMIEVFVDGQAVNLPKGMTVLQACDEAGVDIPRFCYHPRLSIAGNCRMCLVEVEKSPKPVASCAMPAMPGMKIKTNTPLVKKAREGVMEFLLLNHPLDCPICDQGGECDLQDQAMVFGSDRGRFTDMKRSVVDKHLGPLIKTVMTRCIHCTRCVRYATEIAGVEDLGVLGRGNAEEIGTYVDRLSTSEVSGNVIDLCPVGALTSKPYAFTARNWELSNKESIDVSDALGANIRVDHRGPEVMRIVPRLNEDVNEEWLTDKGRFMYDGLKRQRLAQPYVRGPDGLLRQSDWREALQEAANALKAVSGEEIAAVAGKLADVESITALKDLMARLNSQRLYIEGAEGQENADIRPSYLLNTGIAALEDADAVLLVGTDLRSEAPLLNVRLRKAFRAGTLRDIAAVGPEDMDLTYPHEHLGDKAQDLSKLTGGKDGFAAKLAKAERPAIIIGAGVLRRADKEAILGVVDRIVKQAGVIKEGWNGLNVLQLSAGTTGALDLGFVPGPAAKKDAPPAKVVYLLGADEGLSKFVGEDSFVIYQGHHGDQGASRANVVLPGAAYTEKEATYVNTEGRPQRTVAAVPVPGNAREDWKIIRALSEIAGVQLPYDTTDAVRRRAYEIAPQLERTEEVEVSEVSVGARTAPSKASAGPLLKEPFGRAVPNFYMTDPISRASQTMARCTSMFKSQKEVDAQEHWLLHADWGKQKAAKQPAL